MITTVTLNASIDKAYYMDKNIENGTVMRVASCNNTAGGKGLNVARVAKLKKGETVGYGGSFVANEDCFVATVSAGYADGVPRAFTGGEVLIGGKRRRVVGNVCMDYCFALADKAVKTGDEVVFIGSQVSETLTAEDMARSSGTISYEILTGVKRFKKIYIR